MSRTLSLANYLLSLGQRYQHLGRRHDAIRILKRLTGLAEIPAKIAEQAQALLAEVHLQQRRYLRARRHLAVALAYQPDNARYHYLMATALYDDDRGDEHRAWKHYRQSLQANADQAACLTDFGLLAINLRRNKAGLTALRRAAELAPDDPLIMSKVVQGLCRLGKAGEARELLLAARFRNKHDGRFEKLWKDFQFHQLRMAQDRHRRRKAGGADGPVLLPFRRLKRSLGRKVLRQDPPHSPLPPHRLPVRVVRGTE